MLYIMGRKFAEQGHDVTIFSAQPGYNNAYDGPRLPVRETTDGMTIIRIPLLKEDKKKPIPRAINVVVFGLWLFFHAVFRFKPYDLMTVSTFPPTIMATVARAICFFRRTEYIYHCMDLYPEIAQASGLLKRSLPLRIAAWVDKRNCQKAKAVVVLSDDMLASLRNRGLAGDNVHVINNFIIDTVDESASVPAAFEVPTEKFRVLFAGNIGRFQSLETIVDAAKLLSTNDEIEFWFIGAGVSVDALKKRSDSATGQSIHFHPYLPIEAVMKVINRCNLGVVSLAPKVILSAYPSKTMTYLEAGCKLLCLVEGDTSLATLVNQHNLGSVCTQPATADEVASAISKEFDSWKRYGYDRDAIQNVGRAHFGQEAILDCWLRLLGGKSPGTPDAVKPASFSASTSELRKTQTTEFVHSAD
ncbi:putative glycosyl transferase [Mariniblastus fucicola]|uniref:Putative glycosyl transferase n=2 Tax=Mariniblastus fucicola TaxID=980251 RepID=A0A5B9PCR3_9BACT|nr:putative glycosyl transferase [Mariniblastus fucicola]